MARQISLLTTVNKILDLMALADWDYFHSHKKGLKKPTWLPQNASHNIGGMFGELRKALEQLTGEGFVMEWCAFSNELPLDEETFNMIMERIEK